MAKTKQDEQQTGGDDRQRYAVLSPIRLDGETYQPGDTIALTGAQYEGLRASGAIEVAPAG